MLTFKVRTEALNLGIATKQFLNSANVCLESVNAWHKVTFKTIYDNCCFCSTCKCQINKSSPLKTCLH